VDVGGRTHAGELRFLAMVVGAGLGGLIAWSNPHRVAGTEFTIFAVLAVILGAASGEVFGFGVSRWREVLVGHPTVRVRHCVPALLAVASVAGLLIGAAPFVVGRELIPERSLTLAGLALFGALPAAGALAAVQRCTRLPLAGPPGAQLGALLTLRRLLSSLLNQLGLLVVLVMLANGAATQWGTELPTTVVIFSGTVSSLIVGAAYVPAASSLRRRASYFVDEFFALDDAPVADLVQRADDRIRLEKMLGTDRTTFDDFKAGLVILAPILASAAAAVVADL
jgi:hypothetical protein